jgi:hypothetical protein
MSSYPSTADRATPSPITPSSMRDTNADSRAGRLFSSLFWFGGDADDGLVEVGGSGGAGVAGGPGGEDAAVSGGEPVATASGGAGDPDDGLVDVSCGSVGTGDAEGVDAAVGVRRAGSRLR